MSGQVIIGYTATELYRRALNLALEGKKVSPRGIDTTEQLGVTLVLKNANSNIIFNQARALNYSFAVAEWLWIMTGMSLEAAILPFNKNLSIAHDEDGIAFAGAYGPKWIQQMDYVLSALRQDPDSRQAIVNIWNDRPRQSKDTPCTLDWQFFIRDGKLDMHARMRSNDAWLGLPYDLFNFTQIQRWVASQLGIEAGEYTHFVGSFHIYDVHRSKASDAVYDYSLDVHDAPQKPFSKTSSPGLHTLQRVLLDCGEAERFRAEMRTAGDEHMSEQFSRETLYSSLAMLSRSSHEWVTLPYILLKKAPQTTQSLGVLQTVAVLNMRADP